MDVWVGRHGFVTTACTFQLPQLPTRELAPWLALASKGLAAQSPGPSLPAAALASSSLRWRLGPGQPGALRLARPKPDWQSAFSLKPSPLEKKKKTQKKQTTTVAMSNFGFVWTPPPQKTSTQTLPNKSVYCPTSSSPRKKNATIGVIVDISNDGRH